MVSSIHSLKDKLQYSAIFLNVKTHISLLKVGEKIQGEKQNK